MILDARTARPVDALLAATAAGALAGLGIARLTLELNPHLADDLSDTLLLHLWLVGGYASAAAVLGGLGALLVAFLRRRRRLADAVVALCGLAPVVYLLLLPGMGLGSELLTTLLASSGLGLALRLAAAAAVLLAAGWGLSTSLAVVARRLRTSVRVVLPVLWGLAAIALFVLVGPAAPPPAAAAPATAAELPPAPEEPPPRVVLLLIDGADLDDVIEPMVAAGELPAFARMMREGAWGSLATVEPTLSALVWTTIITGKPAAEHGIRHFLHFRLPGVRQAIYEFPLHTGLNFTFFPLLEKVPGMPVLRAPYTSNMRRAEALWNVVGRRYRVGAYRWLVSWPAEEVNGFSVAGGLGWVQFDAHARYEAGKELRGQAVYPPALRRLLRQPSADGVDPRTVAAYVGEGHEVAPGDLRLHPIVGGLADPVAEELPRLIAAFDVRFAAASFYSVDPFHHLFNAFRDRGGIFSDAIAERYRFDDARLGEVLDVLGDETQVIVVSDHGYDFEHNHHTYAPPGVFFARGPAFAAGRRVDGLSVYDVAPLVLRLLGMPLPDDMPGARTGAYRAALTAEFLDASPAVRIPTYETLSAPSHESVASPKDDEIREVLKSLGYVE